MIEGIGIDIVEVERIRKIYRKFGDKFLNKVFTDAEISYSFKYSNPFPHLAARFAVKEAIIKALKDKKGLTLKQIEVVNNYDGSPDVKIQGFNKKVLISISHERDYAVAFVIIL